MSICQYKATRKGYLQKHMESIHNGQKFPCPQCEYKAAFKGNLQIHIKSVHEGLKKHIKSVHVKVKSECLSDNDDMAMEEYFETDVKSEVELD